jgi:hypothetical protein
MFRPHKIIVEGGHTYETAEPVEVGDEVLLPTAQWLVPVKGPTFRRRVIAIGSDYDGPCRRILGVLKAKGT